MPTKPSYKSWTLWFNIAVGVWHVLAGQNVVPPIPPGVEALGLAAGNIALRAKTDQPLSIL